MTPQEIEALRIEALKDKVDALSDMVDILKSERDALAVQADLMKAAIKNVIFKAGIVSNICYNIGQQHNESKQILQAVSEFDAARRRFNDLISLDAQQCLRDVQAEAGRAGFIAGIHLRSKGQCNDWDAAADEHAATVRQGGAE